MSRIALAGFLHETNTFSPIPTDYNSFASRSALLCGIYLGEELEQVFRGKNYNNSICGFYAEAESRGHQVVPIAKIGEAEPSAPMTEQLFYELLGLITQGLVEKMPFDGVYLDLHGAMVFGNYQEGEVEIVRKVREVVGNVPLVVSLDLHGNISPAFFEEADMLVGYRTYPHVDIYESGVRCARAMNYLIRGAPVYKAYHALPFLMPGSTLATNHEPSKSLYAMLDVVEQDEAALSVSIMQGFVEADVEYMGPTVFAYATNQDAADSAAKTLLETALGLESQFRADLPDARTAVGRAIHLSRVSNKAIILADGQDNPGGGSSSDTVWILEELVRQNAPDSAVALLYDPKAARFAHAAGEGKQLSINLGGKLTPGHNPFFGTFVVEKLFEGDFVCSGPMMRGVTVNLGKMALLRIDNVRVVVASHRTQILDQAFMRVVGVEPSQMKILVLKSTNHYRADFEPLCSTIIDVDAPSSLINNPEKYAYQNLREGVRLQGLGRVHRKG